ncbi:MAG: hypothetical protein HY553_04475 [Elusimicrobia bacterium]|nr:hypothetical protein [Elusimicrobiota bacterium]
MRRMLLPLVALALAFGVNAARAQQTLQGGADISSQNEDVVPPTCAVSCLSTDPYMGDAAYCNGRQAYLNDIPSGHIRVSWSVQNATSITLDGRSVGASGSEDHLIEESGDWTTFSLQASNAAGTCGGAVYGRTSCFLKGTKILMADGTYKNIEEIQAGELVMGYDTATGTFKPTKVTKPVRSSTSRWFLVNDNLKVSVGHQIMANGKWTWSENLKPGDVLFDAAGNPVKIESIVTHDESVDVYNLITDPLHNFFAGTELQSFLVHNKDTIEGHDNHGLLRGMEVLTVDGRRVKVESLKAGDKIMNYDFKNKKFVPGTVRMVDSQKADGYLVINGTFRVAKKHPMYSMTEEKWEQQLKKGKKTKK